MLKAKKNAKTNKHQVLMMKDLMKYEDAADKLAAAHLNLSKLKKKIGLFEPEEE
jgi:hypothetical protein